MHLRKRFRVNAAISFGAILLLAVGLGLSWHASSRASRAEDLAKALQQQILERGIVKDEYLAYREERARAQWYAKTARLLDLLHSAGDAFDGPDERETIGEMAAIVERSKPLFGEIVEHPDARERDERGRALPNALQERVSTKMLLLYYDLYSHANRLVESASRRARSTQKTTLLSVMGMIGAVLAVTIINALMTSGLLERRIMRLRDGAERVATGNLGHRIAIEGSDELAELGQAFDNMAARLQETYAALETKAAEVGTLNEELHRQVVQLGAANGELEAFSYSVSHDLRAPLRSIDGFSQVLQEDFGDRLGADGEDALGRIRRAARHMGQLIDDLLKLSKVTRAELHRERVDLSEMARSVAADISRRDPKRQAEVRFADGAVVEADPRLLRIVIENLMDNAFKFTSKKADARIEFGTRDDDGRVVYFVRDNGVGFDMAFAGKLFGAFQRLHSTVEFPGTGIGLATVQRIVHRHGGSVRAEGVPGEGATFSFSL
jgi:signal transduction histidine kinase